MANADRSHSSASQMETIRNTFTRVQQTNEKNYIVRTEGERKTSAGRLSPNALGPKRLTCDQSLVLSEILLIHYPREQFDANASAAVLW